MKTAKKLLSILFIGALAASASAADYYVALDGIYEGAPDGATVYTSLDEAITAAGNAADVIHVKPGTYSTTTQDGPNLAAKLIGTGTSRDAVVIQSAGTYRTLRMDAGSWLENVTVVGNTDITKVDNGGAIEMSGGTVTNCVVRDGTAKANNDIAGGNLYMTGGSLVVDCEISGGRAMSRGGNVHLLAGVIRDCAITGGTIVESDTNGIGGNLFVNDGSAVVSNCTITGGTVAARGGNVFLENGSIYDSQISGGVVTTASDQYYGGGNVFFQKGLISRCTIVNGKILASVNRGGGINACAGDNNATDKIIEDCLIADNENGGIYYSQNMSIYNTTIVDNAAYGMWGYANRDIVFENNVLFGNTNSTGAVAAWSNAKTANAKQLATDASTLSKVSGYIAIGSNAFADYDNGDYRPVADSLLVDRGVADSRESASATDLLGNPRLSGTIDIGCYEYQKTTMSVDIALADSVETVYVPANVTFNVSATGYPDGQTPTFTVNFGDGTEEVGTTETEVVHEYTKAGKFTVTVKVSAPGAFNAEKTVSDLVLVGSKTIYVKSGNESAAFPYDTPETGYATVQTAYENATDGSEIIVVGGTYDFSGQLSVTKAVAVRGASANPEDVVFQNTKTVLDAGDSYQYRVLEVNNASARIENITIQNGRVQDQYGANLRLVSGVVSNCVIRGGTASVVGYNANAAGGGVEIAGEATLTHCVISNNVVNGTSDNSGYTGGAVFIVWEKQKARISNCLIAYNRYITSGDAPKPGAAGIHFGGSNNNSSVENCTVVSNVVVGALADDSDSAGIHCTTWYGRLRNNIIAGNYETGKGRCTSVKLDFDDRNNYTYHNNITDDVLITESGTMSKGNILVNSPADIFRDFEHGDFGLRVSCAAYNKGTRTGLALSPSVDLAGKERVKFGYIDIGCYECQKPAGLMILLQ
ncbi:MAG: PKD domain-containing protein [Lentisphaerae bacterium]|jgi:hypothetical protein|nr:PKD domain-containing protein [Lentisphaerota bacterium]